MANPDSPSSQQEAVLATFSPSERQQFEQIIDGKNLTPEQIRALGMEAAVDGAIGQMAWASRGQTEAEPLDHRARTEVNMNEIEPPANIPNQSSGRGRTP